MFKITLYSPALGREIEMPHDKHLGLLEACNYADIYKKSNSQATFTVYNEENGDIEYQV